MRVQIQPLYLGLYYKKGKIKKILPSGNYQNFFHRNITLLSLKKSFESEGLDYTQLQVHPTYRSFLKSFEVPEDHLGFHFIDGTFYDILLPGKHTFFQQSLQHSLVPMDTRLGEVPTTISSAVLKQVAQSHDSFISQYLIRNGYVGALYVDGKFTKLLSEGVYFYTSFARTIFVREINTQTQLLSIMGQEILSQDKVTLRFNLNLRYRIVDPERTIVTFDDFEEHLRLQLQLLYREYLSSKTLDQILSEKESLAEEVCKQIKKQEKHFGIEVFASGIKDIIIPGDVREIMNTVLIAEKKAMANVIARREETASTRSLLNTAKLLDENATLYRLKELEYLEKIFDKVQSLSISSSSSLIEQLTQLMAEKKK